MSKKKRKKKARITNRQAKIRQNSMKQNKQPIPKYKNLMENPSVSLLVDTREISPRSKAKALTVAGVCAAIENEEKRNKVQAELLAVHPHLAEFINHSEAEILCVQIHSFLLLNGLQEAHFQSV